MSYHLSSIDPFLNVRGKVAESREHETGTFEIPTDDTESKKPLPKMKPPAVHREYSEEQKAAGQAWVNAKPEKSDLRNVEKRVEKPSQSHVNFPTKKSKNPFAIPESSSPPKPKKVPEGPVAKKRKVDDKDSRTGPSPKPVVPEAKPQRNVPPKGSKAPTLHWSNAFKSTVPTAKPKKSRF